MTSDQDRASNWPDIPAPRRPWRQTTLAALAILAFASISLLFGLIPDLKYALSQTAHPTELPSETAGQNSAAQLSNRWVRFTGGLNADGVSYGKPLESSRFFLLPSVKIADLWVELRVAKGDEDYYLPPSQIEGRLLAWQDLGLRKWAYQDAISHLPSGTSPPAFVLLQGVDPESERWLLGVAGLAVLFALFALVSMYRIVFPAKHESHVS